MLKIIKNFLFLTTAISSSVFPMTRIAQAILIKRVLNQTTSFHSSLITRCPIAPFAEQMVNEIACEDASLTKTDYADSSQKQNCLIFAKNQMQVDLTSNTNGKIKQSASSQYQDASPNYYENSSVRSTRNYHNKQAEMQAFSKMSFEAKQEILTQERIVNEKLKLSNFTNNFATHVHKRTSEIVSNYQSLSQNELLIQKRSLEDKLCQLENKHRFLAQKNPNVGYTIDTNAYGLNAESIPYHAQESWKFIDFRDTITALELKVEIEATKIAVQVCDGKIHEIKQEFIQKLESAPLDTIEQEIIPSLAIQQETMISSIAEKEEILNNQYNNLKAINIQLKAFEDQSGWDKFKYFIKHDHSQEDLKCLQKAVAENIQKTNNLLESLHDRHKEINEQIEQAQKVAYKKEQAQLAYEESQKMLQEQEFARDLEAYYPDPKKDSVVLLRDLEQLHEQYQQAPQCFHGTIDNNIIEGRQHALEKTINQSYAQYEQRYQFDPLVAGFLQSQGLQVADFEYCFGTTLQHQLHAEVHQLFYQIAQQKKKSLFTTDIINITDAAHEQNKKEHISAATTLLDISWALAGIPIGIIETSKEFLLLPLRITKGLAQAIYFAAETAALNTEEFLSCGPEAQELWEQRNDLIIEKTLQLLQVAKNICNAISFVVETIALNDPEVLVHAGPDTLKKWHDRNELIKQAALEYARNKTAHDMVKDATHVVANFILPQKMPYAIGHLCTTIATQSKSLRSLECAAALLGEELCVERIFEEVLETTKTLQPTTPQGISKKNLAEFMKAESTVIKAAKIVPRPAKIVFDEIRNFYKGVIPFSRQDLREELTIILEEIQLSIKCPTTEKIKKLYGQQMIDGKLVKPNFDHAFKFEFGFDKSTRAGGFVLEIKGGHVAEVWEKLEHAGLVKILEKNILQTGAIDYMVQDLVTGKKLKKTVFPPSWTKEKIAKAMWDVYKNSSEMDALSKDKVNLIRNGAINNFEMHLLLKNITQSSRGKNYNGCNIISVLPYKGTNL